MMAALQFTVPGQPQGKGRPRIGRVGPHARMFTPAKTAAYEALVALAAQEAMGSRELITGPVQCALSLRCQIPSSWSRRKREAALAGELRPTTRPDADNVVKAVFDGLNGVAWHDDVQVVELSVAKVYADTPGVFVTVQPLDLEGYAG